MRDPYGIVGTTLDRRYAVRRVVAEGGFGVVYEADAIQLDVPVAIKVLRSEHLSAGSEARARFEQEARVLARLHHPAIVTLSDSAVLEDGTPYLVLAWIDGETLDTYVCRRGRLPLLEVIGLLSPVASAISYAHHAGVIHRDLKMPNVMVGPEGVHVLDFGVARWSNPLAVATTTLSSTGVSLGYAAPEQYGREFGPVDARADQFAFAAIVYACLTGEHAFSGETLTEVMYATCVVKQRPSVRTRLPDFPPTVDHVVQRALSIRPADRFPTIDSCWDALTHAARDAGLLAAGAQPWRASPHGTSRAAATAVSAVTDFTRVSGANGVHDHAPQPRDTSSGTLGSFSWPPPLIDISRTESARGDETHRESRPELVSWPPGVRVPDSSVSSWHGSNAAERSSRDPRAASLERASSAASTRPDPPLPMPSDVRSAPAVATLPSPSHPHAPNRTTDVALAATERARGYATPVASPPSRPTEASSEGAATSSSRGAPSSSWRAGSPSSIRIMAFVAAGALAGAAVYAFGPWSPAPTKLRPRSSPSASHSRRSTSSSGWSGSGNAGASSGLPSATGSAGASPAGVRGDACRDVRPEQVCVPGARTQRGPFDCATAASDPAHRSACPAQEVAVPTFALDRREVTARRYRECIAAGHCVAEKGESAPDDAPVRGVTWRDATAFCSWDRGGRLPTDEEWELAATGTEHREFPWGNERPDATRAVFAIDGRPLDAPRPAGSAPAGATPDGIVDLAGNVAEWTATAAPSSASSPDGGGDGLPGITSPQDDGDAGGPRTGGRRWVRGGSFRSDWDKLRTWTRDAYWEGFAGDSIGFRCARSLDQRRP